MTYRCLYPELLSIGHEHESAAFVGAENGAPGEVFEDIGRGVAIRVPGAQRDEGHPRIDRRHPLGLRRVARTVIGHEQRSARPDRSLRQQCGFVEGGQADRHEE